MDNFIVTLLFMAIIGGLQLGRYKSLAIKMLFRPYKAIYIKIGVYRLHQALYPNDVMN